MNSPIINTLKSSMEEILSSCESKLLSGENLLLLMVMDPTPWIKEEHFPGCAVGEEGLLFRSLKCWGELAEVLSCRLGVPQPHQGHLLIELHPLSKVAWRGQQEGSAQAYDPKGTYGQILKTEDPHWLRDYRLALKQCRLDQHSRILSLGVNRGDELAVFRCWYPESYENFHFTGFDLSEGALAIAKQQLSALHHRLERADLRDDPPEDLEPQDLILSLSTLQSSNMDGKEVFRNWFQKTLSKKGHVILGFPNCTWHDGEQVYGAPMRNQPHPDPSLVMKDLMYYRKYLQTHGKRVSIIGKHYLFLVGSAF